MSIRMNETRNPNAIPSNVYNVQSYAVDVGRIQQATGAVAEYNSTNYWNTKKKKYIPKRGTIIVYSDAGKDLDGNPIPKIKIADGTTYVVDLPFINDTEEEIIKHVNDKTIHVTPEEKELWNSGITLSANDNEEMLIVNKIKS